METKRYEPSFGIHITSACKEAVAMAMNGKCNVKFDFNGIEIEVTPDSTPFSAEVQWQEKKDADAKAYRESAEYREEQARRERQIKTSQDVVDHFMDGIEQVLFTCSMDSLLEYLRPFVEAADDVDVTFDKSKLADMFEAAGYAESAHVGKPPESFVHRKIFGEYILGQVVHCLRAGMPPHPVAASFIEKYFRLQA